MPGKIQIPPAKPRWAFPQPQREILDKWKPMGLGSLPFSVTEMATMELTAHRDLPAVQPSGSRSPTLFLLFLVSTLGESNGHKAPGWEG